ncbi:putative Coiled-coil domain-containing protein SCD2 [Helianthus debilis subsp. tardiflorus]
MDRIGKKSQKTKEAAQKLARMMSHQLTNDSDDDLLSDYNPPPTTSQSHGRTTSQIIRPGPIMTATEHQSAPRATSIGPSSAVDQILTANSLPSNTTMEHVQPTSARSAPPPARPTSLMKPVIMVPATVALSLRPSAEGDTQTNNLKNKRLSLDLGALAFRESGYQRSTSSSASTSALQDEIDMLQEENESLLEKLRIAEERCTEAEVRARQLEKQVAHLGEGVSLEAKLLNRKEAALQQREAALKAAAAHTAAHNTAIKGEVIDALRQEAENARDQAAYVMEKLYETEHEVRSLKTMTQRMVLTHEEMEEVVLKRCWLARYWSLCAQHGIHPEIAGARYEYWSSFAPLPVEVVIAAGQKAKHHNLMVNNERKNVPKDATEISGEGSVESMLLVERALREMTLLKIEDALALAMAQQRWASRRAGNIVDETKLPIKGQHTWEPYELSKQESDDVLFKQAWLLYFWRRVKIHGLEPDIVDERLQFWINQGHPPTSHDAVNVERGLIELRKLAIEAQLWQASRKLVDPDSEHKWQMHINF